MEIIVDKIFLPGDIKLLGRKPVRNGLCVALIGRDPTPRTKNKASDNPNSYDQLMKILQNYLSIDWI